VFEAMAAGKTIVSTDADGLREVLTPDTDALMVPRRDAPALADAVVRLIDDPALRQRLGAASRQTAEAFDIQLFVDKMQELYNLLHGQSRVTRRRLAETHDLAFLTRRAR
jgi:glycosyltransferase involved in cell wall biosynthesis